jgi:hypothetical protein
MDPGELLTRWTVRLALSLYVLSLSLRLLGRGRPSLATWARLAWTAGYLAFLVHVICAFHFYHHWSHAAAYESTARQTEDVVGQPWGAGLYANYAFALVWGADVLWWWLGQERYRERPRWLEWAVQAFLGFIAFNATVVFGVGVIRWLGVLACVVLVALLGYSAWHGNERKRDRHVRESD